MKNYKKISIKNWALEDRPREKLLHNGLASLSDAELIAILIGSGTKKESAVELSRHILNDNQNKLHELARLNIDDLCRYHGIGEAKAISIVAALELGRRRKREEILQRKKITSSADVASIFIELLGDLNHEEFWVILLNRSNQIMERFHASKGGVSSTVIDVKIILKKALLKLVPSFIVIHNHPSGNLQPSEADIMITRKLKDSAKIMDITLLDHLIVTQHGHFSFADSGMI